MSNEASYEHGQLPSDASKLKLDIYAMNEG